MLQSHYLGLVVLFVSIPWVAQAADPVFSGPQVGEVLPGFRSQGLVGDLKDKEFDLIADAEGGPVLLIFLHERTRPGFGLMRAMANFAATKSDKGIKTAVIFLTDDLTATSKWSKNVRQHFADGVIYAASLDGKEGPGSYGLNRNVTLTVLVGNKGKVTGNFAIVQPQLQADGPKILQAIVDVTGGGKVPSVSELEPRYAGRGKMERGKRGARDEAMKRRGNAQRANDPKLTELLRSVINKQADADEVKEAATAVEKYVDENENARKELARIVSAVVNSGKIANYGTEPAQKILQGWLAKYAKQDSPSVEE